LQKWTETMSNINPFSLKLLCQIFWHSNKKSNTKSNKKYSKAKQFLLDVTQAKSVEGSSAPLKSTVWINMLTEKTFCQCHWHSDRLKLKSHMSGNTSLELFDTLMSSVCFRTNLFTTMGKEQMETNIKQLLKWE
jgi:hypothetical protein